MKLILMPKQLTWWIWLVIALLLIAGLTGWPAGLAAAIVLSTVHTVFFAVEYRSLTAFPVQIRLGYTLCLLVFMLPPFRFGFWLAVLGVFALILFGYCVMARMLSLMPWNRTRPFTLRLLWRTFASPPVIGNMQQGLPCPGGVCALEQHAAAD